MSQELADVLREAAAVFADSGLYGVSFIEKLDEAATILEELGGIEPLDPDVHPQIEIETITVYAEEPSPCWRLMADPNGARSLMPELRVVAGLHDHLMEWVRCELTTDQLDARLFEARHALRNIAAMEE